jgi:hypothetical protein
MIDKMMPILFFVFSIMLSWMEFQHHYTCLMDIVSLFATLHHGTPAAEIRTRVFIRR